MTRVRGIFAFLIAAGLLSAITLAAGLRPTVGFAVSDSQFVAGGSEVTGQVTVFGGESVTSGHLPTRLNLQDGWRFLIGVGSRVQVSQTALQLDGGSLEIVAVGQTERPLHVAGLRVVPRDRDTKAALYISRADVFAVSVESGEITVLRPNGDEVQTVEAGSMATFANTRDEIRMSETDAALEIGAVQAAELKHLGKLGKLNSAIGEKAGLLLGALAGASGGFIRGGEGGGILGGGIPAGGIADAAPGGSAGGGISSMGSQPMVATDGMNALYLSSGTAGGTATGAATRVDEKERPECNARGEWLWATRPARYGTRWALRFGAALVAGSTAASESRSSRLTSSSTPWSVGSSDRFASSPPAPHRRPSGTEAHKPAGVLGVLQAPQSARAPGYSGAQAAFRPPLPFVLMPEDPNSSGMRRVSA